MLDITYHYHMMELHDFIDKYNSLSKYTRQVHIIDTDGVPVEDLIGFLGKYGIKAKWAHKFTDDGIFTRKPKTV